MTSIALEAIDLVTVITQVRDRESLILVSRVLESQLTVLQAQVAQLEQVQKALTERAKTLDKG
jgi:cell division protein FtsB